MDVRQLKYFVHVATYGGFNRAATQVNVAQSALSRQIQMLEQELGVTLFLRTADGVRLTPQGETFLSRVGGLLRHFQEICDEAREGADVPRGELVIGIPAAVQGAVATDLLTMFRQEAPLVFPRTWIDSTTSLKDLVISGTVDIALVGPFDPDPLLETSAPIADRMFLVGAAQSDLKGRTSVLRGELSPYPLILASNRSVLNALAADNGGADMNLNVVIEAAHMPLALDLVRRGAGYTLLPYVVTRSLEHDADFTLAQVSDLSIEWRVISSRRKQLSPAGRCAYRLLVDIVSAAAAGRPPPQQARKGAQPRLPERRRRRTAGDPGRSIKV